MDELRKAFNFNSYAWGTTSHFVCNPNFEPQSPNRPLNDLVYLWKQPNRDLPNPSYFFCWFESPNRNSNKTYSSFVTFKYEGKTNEEGLPEIRLDNLIRINNPLPTEWERDDRTKLEDEEPDLISDSELDSKS